LILGAGWAFLGLVVAGIAALLLVPACGLVVVSKAPPGNVSLEAPPLVQVDPVVEAAAANVATVSVARARLQARRGALRIRNTACDGVRSGSGFALDPTLLVADEEVLPGAAAIKVAPRKAAAKTVGAARVYRLGELAVARVEGRLPRAPAGRATTASGASVAVVGYPLSATPRVLPGVVVDTVSGTPFGVHGPVLRLTSVLRDDEPGGPVIDAKGRIVAVAFATDPGTGFAVAAPIATLRSLVAARALEALPPCDGT
jgi:hypothetical protein